MQAHAGLLQLQHQLVWKGVAGGVVGLVSWCVRQAAVVGRVGRRPLLLLLLLLVILTLHLLLVLVRWMLVE